MDIFQLIGFIGMLFVVYAYFLLQDEKVTSISLKYQILNLAGAVLLILSLLVHFNLGSFMIEIFWIAITIYGIVKNCNKKKKKIP